MFVWLTFPTLTSTTTHELFEAFAKADVIVVPGPGFRVPTLDEVADASQASVPSKRPAEPYPSVRACYAAVKAEKIVQAIQTMAECVKVLETTQHQKK